MEKNYDVHKHWHLIEIFLPETHRDENKGSALDWLSSREKFLLLHIRCTWHWICEAWSDSRRKEKFYLFSHRFLLRALKEKNSLQETTYCEGEFHVVGVPENNISSDLVESNFQRNDSLLIQLSLVGRQCKDGKSKFISAITQSYVKYFTEKFSSSPLFSPSQSTPPSRFKIHHRASQFNKLVIQAERSHLTARVLVT